MTPLTPPKRLLIFSVGMLIAIILLVYSVNWDELPIQFVAVGQNVTIWVTAGLLVMTSIFTSTFIKTGIYGKWKWD